MRLVLRLVETGVEGVVRSVDMLEIDLALRWCTDAVVAPADGIR